jgi:hypothetical protein
MIGRLPSAAIGLAAVLLAWGVAPDTAHRAQAAHHYRTSPDLFYNYYVPSGSYGGVPAQLYLSPRPTPPVVGHTYVTYQPLLPHEFLYPHHRRYWRYNPSNGRWTRTMVVWQRSCCDCDLLSFPVGPVIPAAKCALDPLLGTSRY